MIFCFRGTREIVSNDDVAVQGIVDVPFSRLPDDTSVSNGGLARLLSTLGFSTEALQKITFGSGAVGKISILGVFAFIAIGIATTRTSPTGALIGIFVIAFIVLCALGAIVYIVAKRPELAVLEGTQVVLYKQLTIGAKDYTPSKELPPVPDPGLPPGDKE